MDAMPTTTTTMPGGGNRYSYYQVDADQRKKEMTKFLTTASKKFVDEVGDIQHEPPTKKAIPSCYIAV